MCRPLSHNRNFSSLRLKILAAGLVLVSSLTPMKSTSAEQPATEEQKPSRVLESGLLLLHGGKVIKGRITREGGEYRVQKSRGEMYVPEERVDHVCLDLHDAYLKQRADIEKPTAAHHVELARWCLSYNQLEEARVELIEALKLEPARVQSRRMLRRLDAVLGYETVPDTGKAGVKQASSSEIFHEVESLGGLSREDAQRFTSVIQPILVHGCAAARCHSSSTRENGFALVHVKAGRSSNRRDTQRNLAAVMKLIDVDTPGNSQLIKILDGEHPDGKLLFSGRSGRRQQEELREWILSVSNGKNDRGFAKQDLKQQLNKTLSGKSIKSPRIDWEKRIQEKENEILRGMKRTTDAFNPAGFNQSSSNR